MRRILIIDDEYINRLQLKALLAPYGDCDIAPSVDIALLMYKHAFEENLPYNLITLDIEMPGKNGTMLKEIRAFENEQRLWLQEKEVKVLMISVKQGKEDILGSFREGCEHFIIKPVTPEKLQIALEKLQITRTQKDKSDALPG